MALRGLRWCRGCARWLAADAVRAGVCLPCERIETRARYRTMAHIREKARAAAEFRRRGVGAISSEARQILMEEFGGLCAYCGDPATTMDHIVPVKSGGLTEPANIVPACRQFNSSKRTKDVWVWLEETGIQPCDQFFARLDTAHTGIQPTIGPIAH